MGLLAKALIKKFPEGRPVEVYYDRHELDLLSHLTLEEQIEAVRCSGSIETARKRTAPSTKGSA